MHTFFKDVAVYEDTGRGREGHSSVPRRGRWREGSCFILRWLLLLMLLLLQILRSRKVVIVIVES